MKYTLLLLITLLLSFSCSVQKSINQSEEKAVGIAQKTANPNNPYVYKKGFLNYAVSETTVIQNNDTITLNELKFNAVSSAMYIKKAMYDKFGKWTKEIRTNNQSRPILLWENVRLFEDQNKLFNVYANGKENWDEIYASVLVYDDDKNDCLKKGNILREKIINYFSKSIQNLNDNKDFFDVYMRSINE